MWATRLRCPSCPQRCVRAGRSCRHATPPLGCGWRAPDADVDSCTTRLENTHGTETLELLYPWHPWFALLVAVHEAIDKSDGVVFRCSLSGSDADRWLEVPAWMFDRSACARVRVVADAHAELAALTALATLLRHALSDHFASSNAPLSGVSSLSRDQNRGEAHATPDEAEAGVTPRAATNRPVRRATTAGGRQRAGVVRAAEGDTGGADRPDDTVDPGACRQEPDGLDDGGRP